MQHCKIGVEKDKCYVSSWPYASGAKLSKNHVPCINCLKPRWISCRILVFLALRPSIMSHWKFTIIIIAWAFSITVSPYPALPEDNLFYTGDFTTPESLSVSSGSLTPDSSPILYENDGTGASVSPGPGLGDMGSPSDDELMTDPWAGFDELDMPILGVSTEPTDVDLPPMNSVVALDPSNCPPDLSKHDKPTDLALGS